MAVSEMNDMGHDVFFPLTEESRRTRTTKVVATRRECVHA